MRDSRCAKMATVFKSNAQSKCLEWLSVSPGSLNASINKRMNARIFAQIARTKITSIHIQAANRWLKMPAIVLLVFVALARNTQHTTLKFSSSEIFCQIFISNEIHFFPFLRLIDADAECVRQAHGTITNTIWHSFRLCAIGRCNSMYTMNRKNPHQIESKIDEFVYFNAFKAAVPSRLLLLLFSFSIVFGVRWACGVRNPLCVPTAFHFFHFVLKHH